MGTKELIQRDSGECEEELDKDRTLKISTFKRQLKKEEHLRAAEKQEAGREEETGECSTMHAGGK